MVPCRGDVPGAGHGGRVAAVPDGGCAGAGLGLVVAARGTAGAAVRRGPEVARGEAVLKCVGPWGNASGQRSRDSRHRVDSGGQAGLFLGVGGWVGPAGLGGGTPLCDIPSGCCSFTGPCTPPPPPSVVLSF